MATTKFSDKQREVNSKAIAQKKKRRKKKAKITLFLLFVISILVLCVLSLTVFFKIETISVAGNSTYTAEEILSAAEINKGDNLIRVSGEKLSEKLSVMLPFIEKVKVEKTLPDSLKLIVTETKEEFCFVNKGNCFSANKNGKIIKKYDTVPEELIKVTVSDNVKFTPGKKILFNNEREQTLFEDYLDLTQELKYKVNFINISDYFASYIKIDDRIIVKFGSSSYFDDKVAYLKASLGGVSNTAEGVFDLSAWTPDNNQPVLTYGDISSYEK